MNFRYIPEFRILGCDKGHPEARSWPADLAWIGGDLQRRGRGEEGADMWGPHVSDWGEKRRRGWKAQCKGGKIFLRRRHRHAVQTGR
jgi:hypothetical protein